VSDRRLFVPGRIEVFGKHTDYAGGHSMTCATEQGFAVSFAPRRDAIVSMLDETDGSHAEFPLTPDLVPPVGTWSNYPMTVARRLARNFPGMAVGADVRFRSTLPPAAGLSSSSALIIATYLVLADVNSLNDRPEFAAAIPSREALAGYLGCIENGRAFGPLPGDHGVGTAGGSQDHTAILLSLADHVSWYRYHPVERLGRVRLLDDLIFAVASSGVAAVKTAGARDRYNRASALVSALVAEWRRASGRDDATLADALASGSDAAVQLRELARRGTADFAGDDLERRLEQFILEDGVLVPAAIAAFANGQLEELGRLSDESQRASETLLGNQVPETIALARLARAKSAIAASAFGAGFGGSVWALVPGEDAPRFIEAWRAAYLAGHPSMAGDASFFATRPAAGAHAM
jgi:galactokinase